MVAGEAGLIRSPLVRELALRELPSLSVLRPPFVFLPLPLFFTSPGFQRACEQAWLMWATFALQQSGHRPRV